MKFDLLVVLGFNGMMSSTSLITVGVDVTGVVVVIAGFVEVETVVVVATVVVSTTVMEDVVTVVEVVVTVTVLVVEVDDVEVIRSLFPRNVSRYVQGSELGINQFMEVILEPKYDDTVLNLPVWEDALFIVNTVKKLKGTNLEI